PIRILSFAERAGAVCAEKGEARIPDIPAAAMYLDESARNSRREDLCSSIIIYRGTNKRRDAKYCASVICLASLQGPGLVALLIVDAAFIAARHRHVTQRLGSPHFRSKISPEGQLLHHREIVVGIILRLAIV